MIQNSAEIESVQQVELLNNKGGLKTRLDDSWRESVGDLDYEMLEYHRARNRDTSWLVAYGILR